ncbi:MAG: hypothetical protein P4M12_02535 [Gammaproteobacteria bacterium]|nr:hypothetical protein [Gammaproteobacteria bacterium]
MKKIIELAYLRNKLASKKFDEKDMVLLNEIKKIILNSTSEFKEIAVNAICNCEIDIKKSNFELATQEIQLIHNFTFEDYSAWDSDHFYRIELLSYIEIINDSARIKKLISLLAKLKNISD